MYVVTIQSGFNMKRYTHTQRKIAERQFKMYEEAKVTKEGPIEWMNLEHITKKKEELLNYYPKPE